MPYDILTGDPGLKDDFDGTIESALFVQSDFGGWQAQLIVHADDGEDATLRLGIGRNGWESYDAGDTVVGPRPESRFNTNTAYFKFIAACMKAGAADEMRDRTDNLYHGDGPKHANFWVGMRFHFDLVNDPKATIFDEASKKYVPREGGKDILTPTRYLGTGKTTAATTPDSIFDASDEAKLLELAHASADRSTFANAVMQTLSGNGDPMAKNPLIMARLQDKAWFEGVKAEQESTPAFMDS